MKRSGSDTRALSREVLVRMGDDLHACLSERAAAAPDRPSIAGYLRTLAETDCGIKETVTRKRVRAPVSPDADLAVLANLARTLARYNGMLKVTAQALRESGINPLLHSETETTLKKTRAAADLIQQILQRALQ